MCSRCPTRAGAPRLALAALALWALVNGGLVEPGSANGRWSRSRSGLPAPAPSSPSARCWRAPWLTSLRYCGEHSIVIYLAFFLPMATTRTLLLHAGPIIDIGTISLIVTIAGVIGALVIWWIALRGRRQFPVRAPAAFWIAPKKPRAALQAAE